MNDIPSAEMPELDLGCVFVVRDRDRVVGAAGYKLLSKSEGKTTVLAVRPEYLGTDIGGLLQEARLREMAQKGIKKVALTLTGHLRSSGMKSCLVTKRLGLSKRYIRSEILMSIPGLRLSLI